MMNISLIKDYLIDCRKDNNYDQTMFSLCFHVELWYQCHYTISICAPWQVMGFCVQYCYLSRTEYFLLLWFCLTVFILNMFLLQELGTRSVWASVHLSDLVTKHLQLPHLHQMNFILLSNFYSSYFLMNYRKVCALTYQTCYTLC